MPKWTKKNVGPAGVLDGASTLDPHLAIGDSRVIKYQIDPAEYLTFAELDLKGDCDRSFVNAVSNAKRAVCRRIDGILVANHLWPFMRKKYPKKARALQELAIQVEEVVQNLNIGPRNTMEHEYNRPDKQVAKNALEIARMFIHNTAEAAERPPIVWLGESPSYREVIEEDRHDFNLEETLDDPFVFVDYTRRPAPVCLFHPDDGECLFASSAKFSNSEAMEFAKILWNWQGSPDWAGARMDQFREQAGF